MRKKILSTIEICALALVFSFGMSYALAWTAPSSNPPTGNVSAPINTSATAQTKAGEFIVLATTTVSNLKVINKLVFFDGTTQKTAPVTGGAFWYSVYTFNGSFCYMGDCQPNPKTGGYSCPAGFTAVGGITGQAWRNSQGDETIYHWVCV